MSIQCTRGGMASLILVLGLLIVASPVYGQNAAVSGWLPAAVSVEILKADGTPLRMFDSPSVKIDLSKRSKEDMGFWHRNVDFHEVIICFRGALRWETEMKTVTLHAGEILVIPKGITHRSMLCDESEAENILIELKVRDLLTFVGDKK